MSTAVVTGASGGGGASRRRRIGAPRLPGWSMARGRERLESAARDARSLGSEALPICIDVVSFDKLQEELSASKSSLGPSIFG
jgi:NADP-dependent 3-hydroxy acid dehydrogenase YdfG